MTTATLDTIRDRLQRVNQEHLLGFVDGLSNEETADLLGQIGSIDLEKIPALVDEYVMSAGEYRAAGDLEPAPFYPRDPGSADLAWDRDAMRRAGEALIAAGRVGCFTVAGGQGSRLGYDGPKGCYPTGAVSGKPLFQIFAEGILARSRRHGVAIPWYIMTSPLNHDATVSFFETNAYFGLSKENVMFFMQGTMPSFELATGRILMAGKSTIATNPDGHGGSLKALVVSGATADMRTRGVEHVSYFQVDNPNVNVLDPVFIGLHSAAEDSSAEMSSKMLRKAEAKEKVGVFCKADGRTMVVEYSDLPDALAEQIDSAGSLRFVSGSPAIHLMSVEFIERLAHDPAFSLPYHRAVKKVPCIDFETGEAIEPTEANGVKLERFVFDAIPLAERSIVLETDRVEEFAPVKNKDGVDSIVTSKLLQTERAARWLEAAGVGVPRKADGSADCVIEISPLTATCADDLLGLENLPGSIAPGETVSL